MILTFSVLIKRYLWANLQKPDIVNHEFLLIEYV